MSANAASAKARSASRATHDDPVPGPMIFLDPHAVGAELAVGRGGPLPAGKQRGVPVGGDGDGGVHGQWSWFGEPATGLI